MCVCIYRETTSPLPVEVLALGKLLWRLQLLLLIGMTRMTNTTQRNGLTALPAGTFVELPGVANGPWCSKRAKLQQGQGLGFQFGALNSTPLVAHPKPGDPKP